MDNELLKYCDELSQKLEGSPENQILPLLSAEDDRVLWTIYQSGHRQALSLLFRRHHRQIVVWVYQNRKADGAVRLADVQDAFGDFVEQILSGKFAELELKKDFPSFACRHITFLLQDRVKKKMRREALRENQKAQLDHRTDPHRRVEAVHDYHRIIDCIPKIGNKVYRMVLYLVFVEGYDSQDLSGLFGKSALAYDKKSRAIKAFRELLEKNGILQELQ